MSSSGIAACFLATALISRTCFHRPNPTPTERHDQDSLMKLGVLLDIREYCFIILSFFHIWITITFPNPPDLICPNPESLNPTYFTWTTYTAALTFLICFAGIIRITAFYYLDKNFTFELAVPNKLVTTGIYAYVQHPSYLPD